MPSNEITITPQEGILLVSVGASSLGEELAQTLLEQVLGAAQENPGQPVVVNLSQVMFMPSLAIGGLLTLRKKLKDGGQRLMLVGIQPPVRSTLAMCRLDKLFELSESEGEARSRLAPPQV